MGQACCIALDRPWIRRSAVWFSPRDAQALFSRVLDGRLPWPSRGFFFASSPTVNTDRITMRHVAERAGVTQATVSMALANHPRISAETRARIRALAERMGYQPNAYISVLMRARRRRRPVQDRPVLALVSLFVMLDVGGPVVFWQERVGRGGRRIRVHMFRTLGHPLSASGRLLSDEERLSPFGRFLRLTRLDEAPQLFDVLRGDLSLIGPRPLLPADLPPHAFIRLLAPPGLTGWAQVHGGKLVSAQEKGDLDAWYVRNASLLVDLRILLLTLRAPFRGDRRDEAVLRLARMNAALVAGADGQAPTRAAYAASSAASSGASSTASSEAVSAASSAASSATSNVASHAASSAARPSASPSAINAGALSADSVPEPHPA